MCGVSGVTAVRDISLILLTRVGSLRPWLSQAAAAIKNPKGLSVASLHSYEQLRALHYACQASSLRCNDITSEQMVYHYKQTRRQWWMHALKQAQTPICLRWSQQRCNTLTFWWRSLNKLTARISAIVVCCPRAGAWIFVRKHNAHGGEVVHDVTLFSGSVTVTQFTQLVRQLWLQGTALWKPFSVFLFF